MLTTFDFYLFFMYFIFLSRQGSVIATVNNIYENITLANEEIQEVIDQAIKDAANSIELLKDVVYESKYCLTLSRLLVLEENWTWIWHKLHYFKESFVVDLFHVVSLLGKNLCDIAPSPCEMETTKCESRNGLAFCFCKDDYIHNPYSNKSCLGNNCLTFLIFFIKKKTK